jgi:putative ABC transport system permease protein
VRTLDDTTWRTIVGVVGDTRHLSLAEVPKPILYTPYAQSPGIFSSVVARVAGDPDLFGSKIRDAIWSVDRDQPVWKIRSLQSLVDRTTTQPRFTMRLVGAFAALALVLAVVGLYGVMSYAVQQRTQEVGIRVALGAQRSAVVALVMRRGMTLVFAALVLGIGAALVLGRAMQGVLYGVKATDPATFVVVSLVLAVVAGAAAYVPARRAARIDPAVALRHE